MDFGENVNEPVPEENVPLKQKWTATPAPSAVRENVNGCFECNICLDSANDPVVTLCGHLYCWPCIYKWLQVQSSSRESDEQPQCPVCKAYITNSTLVPLYGRGKSFSESETQKPQWDSATPRRPQALGLNMPVTSQPNRPLPPNSLHPEQYFHHALDSYTPVASSSFGSTSMTSFYSPTVLMFGEMVFARLFGGDAGLSPYLNSNSYPLLGSDNSRVRRQEMEVDKSLSRVSIFLLCCIVLCLLLF